MCGESFRNHTPPAAPPGGHDVSDVSADDARAFLSAYLNNQPGELERLRARLAPATVSTPEAREARYVEASKNLAGYIAARVDEYGALDQDFSVEFEVEDWNGDNEVAEIRGLVLAFEQARRAAS